MSGPKAKKNKKIVQRKTKKTGIFLGLGVVATMTFVFAAAALDAPAMIARMFEPTETPMEVVAAPTLREGAIADDVFIDGINVSGLTTDEALEKLYIEVREVELAKVINFIHEDKVFSHTFADLEVVHDFMPAVDFAYSIGREREAEGKVELISDIIFEPLAASNAIFEVMNEINQSSQDATMVREYGEFIITPEIVGLEVNQQKLAEDLLAVINARQSADIVIEVDLKVPELTEEIFARSTSRLGSFYTIISGNDPGRNQNLLNASYKINNYMVMPGEIFSTNRAFGEMTYENGYRLAPVIVNGQLVPGMGGGICQVSTNLYIALVFAEVRIVERLNHSMRVAYVDYAWDATLATDLIDLRFENDTGYPLTIVAYIIGNRSYVHIYGHERRDPNRRLELFSVVTERIPAPEETIIEVATLAPGVREVISPARGGVVAELHKIVFDGNTELYRERVNVSRYRARAAIVHVGAGYVPAETAEEDEPDYGYAAYLPYEDDDTYENEYSSYNEPAAGDLNNDEPRQYQPLVPNIPVEPQQAEAYLPEQDDDDESPPVIND